MGRPILYRTSKEFLMRFGLSDLDELPSLKEFEQLARAALGADEGIAAVEPEADSFAESSVELAADSVDDLSPAGRTEARPNSPNPPQ